MNRNDDPEDSSLAERCLTGGVPEFGGPTGSFRRIVQTPGGITIFYDVGQVRNRGEPFAMKEDIQRAATAGFDGYLAKPIDIRSLPGRLAAYLPVSPDG